MNRVRPLTISFLIVLLAGLVLGACAPAAQTPAAEPMQAAPAPTEPPAETEAVAEPTEAVAEPTGEEPAAIQLTDALGREVVFESVPQRIGVAGRAAQLLVDSIYLFPEAVDRVVGIERRLQSINFVRVVDPTLEDSDFLERDAGPEQIAPLNPDVVVMKTFMNETIGAALEQLGIPVVYLELETPEQFFRDIRTLGQLMGNVERAEEIVAAYEERVERVSAATAELAEEERPRVLMLQHSVTGDEVAFEVPPPTWLQTTMVEMAGGQPVWVDDVAGGGWQVVSFDQIAAWNPDQIYVIVYGEDVQAVVDQLKADPQWQALQAVQADQVHAFASDFLSWDQPDSRWILGLQWLATKIHPDLFADLSIADETHWFYTELYGLDEGVYQEQILPLLAGAGLVEN